VKFALVLACLAALGAVGCGGDDNEEQPAAVNSIAELTVTVDPDGDGGAKPKTATVKCGPASDSKECAALADMKADVFEPVPGNVACTQQYGGPETAQVTGTFKGRQVDAKFSRVNGCEISRWEKMSPVFAVAS
jgi:hypothetical protein